MSETSAAYETLPDCVVCGHSAGAHEDIETDQPYPYPCDTHGCGCPGYQRPLGMTDDDPSEVEIERLAQVAYETWAQDRQQAGGSIVPWDEFPELGTVRARWRALQPLLRAAED